MQPGPTGSGGVVDEVGARATACGGTSVEARAARVLLDAMAQSATGAVLAGGSGVSSAPSTTIGVDSFSEP